jgi:hypothetical protein
MSITNIEEYKDGAIKTDMFPIANSNYQRNKKIEKMKKIRKVRIFKRVKYTILIGTVALVIVTNAKNGNIQKVLNGIVSIFDNEKDLNDVVNMELTGKKPQELEDYDFRVNFGDTTSHITNAFGMTESLFSIKNPDVHPDYIKGGEILVIRTTPDEYRNGMIELGREAEYLVYLKKTDYPAYQNYIEKKENQESNQLLESDQVLEDTKPRVR